MSEPLEGGDSTAVTQNGVTVERHLERKGDGIVVTLELSADVRGPAEVDLVDEFPPGLPVEQAGFNVDHEPDDGEVSLERVELHHAIEAATETVVYAIRLSEPADGVTIDPPTIRDVTLPGIPEPDVPAGDGSVEDEEPPAGDGDPAADAGAPTHQQESERRPPDPEPSTPSDGLPEGLSLEDGAGGADDETVGGSANEAVAGSTDETPDETADDPEQVEIGSEASLDGLEGGDGVDPIESALERAEANGAGLDEEPGDGATNPDPATDGDSPAGDPAAAAGPRETGADASPADASQADAASGPVIPRSVKLRLDRLNARVEEFAAYAEALEGIIERQGTAPEILEDIESELAEADERLAAVREEVESLESEHAADVSAVRDDVDSLESRLEDARRDLESDVDGVREDLDAVDGVRDELVAVSDAVDALDDRVDDHEADVDDLGVTVDRVAREVSQVSRNVEAMRSEMETLQDDVDRLLRFREILSDVFGGPVRRATEGNGARFEDPGNGSGPGADRSRSDDRSREGGPSSSPTGPSG